MLVASAMRRTASSLNSVLNFLAFFFPIGLSHYGRYVSPISSRPPCLTFGVHYRPSPLSQLGCRGGMGEVPSFTWVAKNGGAPPPTLSAQISQQPPKTPRSP